MEDRVVVHKCGRDSWSVVLRDDASFWLERVTSSTVDQPHVTKTWSIEWFCHTCLDEILSERVLSGMDQVIALANARRMYGITGVIAGVVQFQRHYQPMVLTPANDRGPMVR